MLQWIRTARARLGQERRRPRPTVRRTLEPLEGRALLNAGTGGGAAASASHPPASSPAAQVGALPGQRPTITKLQAFSKSSRNGQEVVLEASVNAQPHGRTVNSGLVRFLVVGPTSVETLGVAHVNHRGEARLKTRRLAFGETYQIQANYVPSERVIGPSQATLKVTVAADQATKLKIRAQRFFGTAGKPITFTVIALDKEGRRVPTYNGTIRVSSPTDHSARIAAKEYTFTPADQGLHQFSDGIAFRKGGAEVLKVVQASNTKLKGQATFGIQVVQPEPYRRASI